jgi:hypothetical protein
MRRKCNRQRQRRLHSEHGQFELYAQFQKIVVNKCCGQRRIHLLFSRLTTWGRVCDYRRSCCSTLFVACTRNKLTEMRPVTIWRRWRYIFFGFHYIQNTVTDAPRRRVPTTHNIATLPLRRDRHGTDPPVFLRSTFATTLRLAAYNSFEYLLINYPNAHFPSAAAYAR